MCDPLTIAAVGTGLAAGGAGVGAASEYQAGKYNKAIADQNAMLADRDAQDALNRGTQEENRYRRSIRTLQGRQAVTIAANNLEQTGTPLDILSDTALIGEVDAMNIRNNAIREAFGYKIQGNQLRAKGKLDKYAGTTRAAGTILGGAGDVLTIAKPALG